MTNDEEGETRCARRQLLYKNLAEQRVITSTGAASAGLAITTLAAKRKDAGLNRRFDDVVNLPLCRYPARRRPRRWSAGTDWPPTVSLSVHPELIRTVYHYMLDGRWG